jgi:hypothetical protein
MAAQYETVQEALAAAHHGAAREADRDRHCEPTERHLKLA